MSKYVVNLHKIRGEVLHRNSLINITINILGLFSSSIIHRFNDQEDMLIVKDEIFGPVMALMKFKLEPKSRFSCPS